MTRKKGFDLFRILYLSGLLFFFSCSESPYPDYVKTKNGLYYKILGIGDGEIKARSGDYVTAQVIIKTEKDSVLFTTKSFGLEGAVTFSIPETFFFKDYHEGYLYLSEGDSAVFITDAYSVFIRNNREMIPQGMNLQSEIKVETRILKIETAEVHAKNMEAENRRLELGEFEEKKILDKYVTDSNITALPFANGMYYIQLRKGEGLGCDSAKVALIRYKGCFLNGRCFDTAYENSSFDYILSAEEQLIKGLEIGIRKMHKGEKAKFILPSHLAFGSSGSSTGMVPPFTTVVYEVELIKVQ